MNKQPKNRFSILLIANQISVAANIVTQLGSQLDSYCLDIARRLPAALAPTEPCPVILLNVDQLSNDLADNLARLRQTQPTATIILLTPAEMAEANLLDMLDAGADDYVTLSPVGLRSLGVRLSQLYYIWQTNQPLANPEATPSDSAIPSAIENLPAQTTLAPQLYEMMQNSHSQLALQIIGPDNRVIVWNQVAKQFFGFENESVTGLMIDQLPLSSNNLARLKDILDQARTTGQQFVIFDYPLENRKREIRWLQAHVYPTLKNGNSEVMEVCIISTDITALKQAEVENWRYNRELQILLETSRQVTAYTELRTTLQTIAAQAKALLNATACYVYFLQDDNQTLTPSLSITSNPSETHTETLNVGKGVIGSVAAMAQAAMLNFSGTPSEVSENENLLCVPLIASGKLPLDQKMIGLMVATRHQESPFVESDLRFFESMVQHVLSAINNARLFEETQRALEELTVLYEVSAAIANIWKDASVLDSLIRKMVHGLHVYGGYLADWHHQSNQATIRAKFFKDETRLPSPFEFDQRPNLITILNQGHPKVYHLDDPNLDEHERADMARYNCASRLIVPLMVKGGAIGWLELWENRSWHKFTSDKVRLAHTLANQAAVAFGNIQYLHQTQRMLEETAALYQVASALATKHDAQSIMTIVLKEYLQILNLPQGRVLYFDDHRTKLITATKLDITLPAEAITVIQEQINLADNAIYQLMSQTYQPIINQDRHTGQLNSANQTIPLPTEPTLWLSDTAHSALIIPLKRRRDIIGALVVESPTEPRPFEDREISFGQAMADQLSIALQNLALYEIEYNRREQSEILREVSFVVGSSLNLNEVLESILDQLKRVIKYDRAAVHLIEGNKRHLIAGRGFPDSTKIIGLTFPIKPDETDPGSIVIHDRKPLVVDDVWEAFPNLKLPLGKQVKSWLGIPLIAREQVIGLISIECLQSAAYTNEDAALGLAFGQQVAIALENARLHEIAVSKIEHELAIAQEIQETLLPQVVPQVPGLQISGRILPARQVGGDFFHFFSVGDGHQLGVAVGDVSGKGIPAALYMAVAITAIDIQVRTDPPPGELMNRLNQALYYRLKENKMNIGLQVAIFEPLLPPAGEEGGDEARGVLMTAASGGMISPIGATERGCRFLPVSGLPIGALPPPDQKYEDDMFLLDPFTTIIFTSDGIVEAQNEEGELFGFDRLEAAINEIASVRDAETVAEYVISAAQRFMGKTEQHDDMTVVVVVKT